MAHNGYKSIDPDLRVYEPADLWLRYLEPKYRDQAPIGGDEDSRYPHALETFLEMPFREASRHKILWHNAARLYGLG